MIVHNKWTETDTCSTDYSSGNFLKAVQHKQEYDSFYQTQSYGEVVANDRTQFKKNWNDQVTISGNHDRHSEELVEILSDF